MTDKQNRAMKKTIEYCGKKPMGKILKESGYSTSTAHNPQVVTRSKSWTQLLNKYLPDKLLLKKHKELLKISKKVRTYIKGDLTTEYEELDDEAISKALDMGYKLKGKYLPEEHTVHIDNFDEYTPDELTTYLTKGKKPTRFNRDGESESEI